MLWPESPFLRPEMCPCVSYNLPPHLLQQGCLGSAFEDQTYIQLFLCFRPVFKLQTQLPPSFTILCWKFHFWSIIYKMTAHVIFYIVVICLNYIHMERIWVVKLINLIIGVDLYNEIGQTTQTSVKNNEFSLTDGCLYWSDFKLFLYPVLYRIRFIHYIFLFVGNLFFLWSFWILCCSLFVAFSPLKDYAPLHAPGRGEPWGLILRGVSLSPSGLHSEFSLLPDILPTNSTFWGSWAANQ